ncbi:MAG: RecQ family ATP-dependent DNA helicase, partial [Bacteroidota bacterium]|nr:RecQ family ATP-dependent DNA helicase [Bacteroidota bacterium]
MKHPIEILERYWGHSSFRPNQLEIIETVLENKDCLALLPTSGGKSVCFQVPALIKKGICIVISPLIALMQDQVESLKEKGIKAIALTNIDGRSELDRILDNCVFGNYKFLYISPERLENNLVQERIKAMAVNLIAVDEAHCISQWGHDFRPAYRKIKNLRRLCPDAAVIALTATATKAVVKDIFEQLYFVQPKIFQSSFYRKNLSYNCIHTEDTE